MWLPATVMTQHSKMQNICWQNTFSILLLDEANWIGEHLETRLKIIMEKNHNGTFIALNFSESHPQPPFSNDANIVTWDLGDSELVFGFREQLI